jgi:hypothetical protein
MLEGCYLGVQENKPGISNAEAAEPREVPEGELVKNTRQQLKEETPSGFFSALPRTVQMSGLML